MGGFVDLTNMRFGRWTVLRIEDHEPNKPIRYWCRCDCGTEKSVLGYMLKQGRSK